MFGGRQTGHTPVVTYTLIAINVLMFIGQTASATLERQAGAVAAGRRPR